MQYVAFFKSEQRYLDVSEATMTSSKYVSTSDDKGVIINGVKHGKLPHDAYKALEVIIKEHTSIDQKSALKVLKELCSMKVLEIRLQVKRCFFDEKYLKSDFKDEIINIDAQIKKYNNLVAQLQVLLKPIDIAFTNYVGVYDWNNQGRHELVYKEVEVPIKDVMPEKYKQTPGLRTATNYMIDNFKEFLSIAISSEEQSADTDNTFIIYLGQKGNTDGFFNKGYSVAFSNAETFVDIKRAERACSARGIVGYEIWRISSYVEDKVKVNGAPKIGSVSDQIITRQEKKAMENVLKSAHVKDMEKKIAEYEQILRDNKLLEEAPIKKTKSNKL